MPPAVAAIVGATGGIGGALLESLVRDSRYHRVLALSRAGVGGSEGGRVVHGRLDLVDEASIAEAALAARALGEVRLVVCATGVLHGDGLRPEKHWGMLDAGSLGRMLAVNAIGPALLAKHFLPLLPRRGRSVFAALSARVGSIEDNRLGGWYAYRSSKAALNMLLRTFAIELARRAPEAICMGLHPGTVATRLSAPFRDNVPSDKLFHPAAAAERLLRVLDGATTDDSGRVLDWDGTRVPP